MVASIPYNIVNKLAGTRHGRMIYPSGEAWVGRSMELYGEYSELEADVFYRLIKPGDNVIDAGANIGSHTVIFAKLVGKDGSVFAFEPQRLMFQILNGNIALNNFHNVFTFPLGVGESEYHMSLATPVPIDDTGINLGGSKLVDYEDGTQRIQVCPLDNFELPPISFIKGDVEGFEGKMLDGAAKLIHQDRPILYLENNVEHRMQSLIDQVKGLGYDLWWHKPPIFNPHNFLGNPVNAFSKDMGEGNIGVFISINMLCTPSERNMAAVIEGWPSARAYERIT